MSHRALDDSEWPPWTADKARALMMNNRPNQGARDVRILALYLAGIPLAAIARDVGLSRERCRQIVRSEVGSGPRAKREILRQRVQTLWGEVSGLWGPMFPYQERAVGMSDALKSWATQLG